jgi:hypothetical protein
MTKPKDKAPKPKPKPRAVIALPAVVGPLVTRESSRHGEPTVAVTASGLSLVEAVARQGGSQAKCAAELGVALSTFKRIIAEDDGNNETRLAFERGKAGLEFEVANLLLEHGRAGNVIALIFYSKAQLGWQDAPQISTQVGVQIVLPDSMDREAFAKRVEARTISIAAPTKTDEPKS